MGIFKLLLWEGVDKKKLKEEYRQQWIGHFPAKYKIGERVIGNSEIEGVVNQKGEIFDLWEDYSPMDIMARLYGIKLDNGKEAWLKDNELK